MPPLYIFDDYNRCLQKNFTHLPRIYCLTYAEIIPDVLSPLWQQIDEFSNSYQFHYRHDHLFRGMCLNNAMNSTEDDLKMWEKSTFKENEISNIFRRIFNNSKNENIKLEYEQEIHTRLNGEFNEDYNLSLQTLTLYCDSPEFDREKGFGFKITISICIIIIIINIGSSIFDCYLKSLQSIENDDIYYKRMHANQVTRFLTSFSIYRNFCRLLTPNKSVSGIDLSFLDGYRSILSFLIVYEHTYYLQFVHLRNPQFFENLYHQYFMKLMLHGMVIVELFFVLSGLMLYVKMENGQYIRRDTRIKTCFKIYVKLFFSRYMRYLPSLAFLILINTNIFKYLQTAPFSRFIMETNYYLCSEYWWKSLLMFNNFGINDTCLNHTWYIAADFQLYAFYLIVLIFTSKYPNCKLWIDRSYLIIATLSAFIPVFINYKLKLDSIAFMRLESFRYFYLINIETGSHLYLPSYTNLHGFLIGILCGALYMKYLRKKPKAKKSLGKILKYSPYIGWPCIFGIFYVGTTVLWQKPKIWTALYGLLQRHVTVTLIAVTTIILMLCKSGKIPKMLSSLPFRLLARISYQVYLWHFIIVLIIANSFSQPINVTYYLMLIVLVLTYISANVVGLIVAVAIEYPTFWLNTLMISLE
ncbi:Nose resistant to fluoxetine protein 6 [Lucilia cuprina]|nr:Nose resistant to fluoxetine protein 6 [Lucilia cuprina]